MHVCVHLSVAINNKKPTYLFRGPYKELFFYTKGQYNNAANFKEEDFWNLSHSESILISPTIHVKFSNETKNKEYVQDYSSNISNMFASNLAIGLWETDWNV